MIEICRKSPNEARQGLIPGKHDHGQARWEEGPNSASQAKSTKGKDVIIGEERPPRMIKLKSPKDGQWQKNERSKPQQCPKATFDILMVKYKEGKALLRAFGQFAELDQQFCNRELIRQATHDSTAVKFRRLGSSSVRLSSDALISGQAANTKAMGAFADDVSTLPTLDRLVWTVGPPPMHFHPGWLGPADDFGHGGFYTGDDRYRNVGQQTGLEASKTGKPDSLECQTRPSGFLEDSHNSW
jgi:hypothetical protein